jgi:hypothetical protein
LLLSLAGSLPNRHFRKWVRTAYRTDIQME